MMVALAMAYGRTLTARFAQVRMCCISISSSRFSDATLNRDSWNSLGAPTRRRCSAGAQNPLCTGIVQINLSNNIAVQHFWTHLLCATWIYRIEYRVPRPARERSPVAVTGDAKEIPRSPFQSLAVEEAFHPRG